MASRRRSYIVSDTDSDPPPLACDSEPQPVLVSTPKPVRKPPTSRGFRCHHGCLFVECDICIDPKEAKCHPIPGWYHWCLTNIECEHGVTHIHCTCRSKFLCRHLERPNKCERCKACAHGIKCTRCVVYRRKTTYKP